MQFRKWSIWRLTATGETLQIVSIDDDLVEFEFLDGHFRGCKGTATPAIFKTKCEELF